MLPVMNIFSRCWHGAESRLQLTCSRDLDPRNLKTLLVFLIHITTFISRTKSIDKSQSSLVVVKLKCTHLTSNCTLVFPCLARPGGWQEDDCDPGTDVDTRMTPGDGSPGGGRCLSWSSLESDPQTQTIGHVQGGLCWVSEAAVIVHTF